jgi:ABC-2 type transport system permease protein
MFLSGLLIPYGMMPGWLQAIATAFPFKQAGAVPVSILSGTTPAAEIPGIWLTQILWIIGLLILSRAVFSFASRKVTVQGG